MKTILLHSARLLAATALFLGVPGPAAEAAEPAIQSITPSAGGITIKVTVPAGVRRLVLESRSRLGSGTWVPRQSRWHDGTAGEVAFELPATKELEMLRARAEEAGELALPAVFYSGPQRFAASLTTNSAPPGGPAVVGTTDASAGGSLSLNSDRGTAGSENRAVVESDIWQVQGNTVYFFNSARGFQVIDLPQPDQPVLRATLPLAARGEQMYVLPTPEGDPVRWIALLTTEWCANPRSEVHLVRIEGAQVQFTAHLPVAGQILESRLVGNALYLASSETVTETGEPLNPTGGINLGGDLIVSSTYRTDTVVTAFNLANPTAVPAPATHRFAAQPNAIAATDRFLFVATTGPSQTLPLAGGGSWWAPGTNSVTILDISSPDGAIVPRGTFATRGRVQDKFKLHQNGDVVTVVSQAGGVWSPVTPLILNSQWVFQPQETWLETFSLTEPATPTRLGQLKIIANESLFATRFVGDRAYVVTFRQIDPLWIIDLSNPAQPTIRGELQIPGYSSYLQPLGTDRLIAMGVERGQATVALFDVANAADPKQLSKVFLGTGWSWSEANQDEKAFRVFAEQELVLVPWQGQEGDRWIQAMQLLDLRGDKLIKRGVIHHAAQARRAALVGERLVSVSSREFLSVDFSDRDQPRVAAELELGFRVDRVLTLGNRLLEFSQEDQGYGAASASPVLRVAAAAAPEVPLGTLTLPRLNLVGWDLQGASLQLLQFQPETTTWTNQEQLQTNIAWEAQPPKLEFHTNHQVLLVPQPPLITYRTVTNVLVFPLLPTDPPGTQPRIVTNVYQLPVQVPQPPVWETNVVIVRREMPQPPILTTNVTKQIVQVPIPIPGYLLASTIDCTANTPVLVGSRPLTTPTGYWGGRLVALHPVTGTVVWTESGNSSYYYPWAVSDALFAPTSLVAIRPGWGGIWWGGTSSRFLLALGSAPDAAPTLQSLLTLASTGSYSQFSEAFEADGKIHLSERVSLRQLAPASGGASPIKDSSLPIWQPEVWQTSDQLHVIDYADPSDPTRREPVELPGTLTGVSHAGSLLYTLGASRWDTNGVVTTPLTALAYDGLAASAVATLAEAGLQISRIEPDGHALGLRTVKSGDPTRLEAWAVGTDAQWHRYADLATLAQAQDLHRFGEVLIVTSPSEIQFIASPGGSSLTSLGLAEKPCSVWIDWPTTDLGAGPTLWVPRFEYGVLAISPRP